MWRKGIAVAQFHQAGQPGTSRSDHRPAQLGGEHPADLYDPNPSCACSCSAAMPLEWVAIRYAAQNQTVSGSFEACITVPAVTEVCRRQEARSQVNALLDSSQPALPAGRTAEAVRPAHPARTRTRPLIREAALKLDERTGKVGHGGRSHSGVRYSFYAVKPQPSLHFVPPEPGDKP